MNLGSLNRLLREGSSVSGEFLAVDPEQANKLYRELKKTPRVASVTIKQAALDSFNKTLAENMLRMTMFNVLFSSAIAFGVVYNGAADFAIGAELASWPRCGSSVLLAPRFPGSDWESWRR